MPLYQLPSRDFVSKFDTGVKGGIGASAALSGPGGSMATLMHSCRSIEHSNKSSMGAFPYFAKQPVMQALSPRHFAVQVMPRRQSSVLKQDCAAAPHAPSGLKHDVSMSDASRPPPYFAANSLSARAGPAAQSAAAAAAAAAARARPAHGAAAGLIAGLT